VFRLRSFLLALVAAAGAGAYYAYTRPVVVDVATVVQGLAVDAVYASGTVEARTRVEVKARTSGLVGEVYAEAGAQVTRGQILAKIDNPRVRHELRQSRLDLASAEALSSPDAPELMQLAARARALESELSLARSELARSEALLADGAVPRAELERSRGRVESVASSLAANEAEASARRIHLHAERRLRAARVASQHERVDDGLVRAPIDGVLLARSVEPGEVVMESQVLFRVGDTRSLILELSVDEADVARISEGGESPSTAAAITLAAYPRRTFEGHVIAVMPEADRTRKAFLVKVAMDAPPRGLRSGMSAEVDLVLSSRRGLIVPTASELGGHVWSVRDGRAYPTQLELGIRDPVQLEVLAGLDEGDQVVVQGGDRLSPGVRVLPREVPRPAPRGDAHAMAGAPSRQ
jgi:HlyD family secretion protein